MRGYSVNTTIIWFRLPFPGLCLDLIQCPPVQKEQMNEQPSDPISAGTLEEAGLSGGSSTGVSQHAPRDRADMIKNAPLTFSAFEQRPWPIFHRPQPASPWRSFRWGLGCRGSHEASLGGALDTDHPQERASLQAMRAKPWRLLSAVGGLVPSLSRCPEAPRCLPRKRFVTFRPWP